MNPIKHKSLLYRQLLRGWEKENICERYYACSKYAANATYKEINMLISTLKDADLTASLPEIKIGNIDITRPQKILCNRQSMTV